MRGRHLHLSPRQACLRRRLALRHAGFFLEACRTLAWGKSYMALRVHLTSTPHCPLPTPASLVQVRVAAGSSSATRPFVAVRPQCRWSAGDVELVVPLTVLGANELLCADATISSSAGQLRRACGVRGGRQTS